MLRSKINSLCVFTWKANIYEKPSPVFANKSENVSYISDFNVAEDYTVLFLKCEKLVKCLKH